MAQAFFRRMLKAYACASQIQQRRIQPAWNQGG